MRALFHALFRLVAQAINGLHGFTGAIFGERSGISWALAIMLLTVCVRLLMYPLFLKQIKTQRTMQMLQPKIKDLQKRHKGDRETLNAEMMKLYKEHNANPFAGCLPMLLQMPVFVALFQVLSQLAPKVDASKPGGYRIPVKFGLDAETVTNLQSAKIFGAPIGAGFTSPSKLLEFLGASPGPVKVVSTLLILAMAGTTFVTSKQMMGRNAPADASQATQQKILLYVMPVMLGLFGFNVAIGVLIYWTTTNLFSMGQQAIVMKRLGPVDPNAKPVAAGGKAAAVAPPRPAPARTPKPPKGGLPKAPSAGAGTADSAGSVEGTAPPRQGGNRKPSTSKSKRKGQRRGGRR